MKKLIALFIINLFIFGCKQSISNEILPDQSTSADSTNNQDDFSKLTELLQGSGLFAEIQKHKIGNFKRIHFDVWNAKNLNNDYEMAALIITMNYETSYFYRTETSIIIHDEINNFVTCLEKLNTSYLTMTPEVETIVAYASEGNAKIVAQYKENWKCYFNVNKNNDEAIESFTQDDIVTLINLFKLSQNKIKNIELN